MSNIKIMSTKKTNSRPTFNLKVGNSIINAHYSDVKTIFHLKDCLKFEWISYDETIGGCHMKLDYCEIGRRIARRRKSLGLKQAEVEERAELSYKYLSNIERGISIPSTEVIMRLAIALETTPDEFLVGAVRNETDESWRAVAQQLRGLTPQQLELASALIDVAARQKMD